MQIEGQAANQHGPSGGRIRFQFVVRQLRKHKRIDRIDLVRLRRRNLPERLESPMIRVLQLGLFRRHEQAAGRKDDR